ncbi:Hypothetical predicted protein [Podarcis lilfordi]|uniref:Uncharacterized protein n=1 Tax=Podarcis lilfordi TaxID=74358 RepID=A0AA35KRV0_9SAUR|nr:Hypothetical predicted protein [Podarcis lilfordi]
MDTPAPPGFQEKLVPGPTQKEDVATKQDWKARHTRAHKLQLTQAVPSVVRLVV